MEGFIAKKKSCRHLSRSSPISSLAIHRDSHSISKGINNKPKIRIIHIFAPEIIKTDVANFRDLVQRLTGKPSEKDCKKPRSSTQSHHQGGHENTDIDREDHDHDHNRRQIIKAFPAKPLAKRLEMKGSSSAIHEFLGLDSIKEEELYYQEDQEDEEENIGIWNNVNNNGVTNQYDDEINIGNNNTNNIGSGGGFLERFSDLEAGFGDFPLLPSLLNPSLDANSHHLQFGFGLGGPQLA